MREYHALERVDLVLQSHEVGYSFVAAISEQHISRRGYDNSPLIWIVDALERDVFLILEETVELRTKSVEAQFGKKELYVCSDQGSVAWTRDEY